MAVIGTFASGQLGAFGIIGVLAFLALSTYAAFSDITRYQIPNWISLAIIADFVVIAAFGAISGTFEPLAMAWRLGAGVALLIAGFGLFAANIIGGGDAKLLAASAVWFGWAGLFRYVILMTLLGGLLAIVIIGLRRFAPPRAWSGQKWLANLRSGEHGIPYAIAIAGASWLMFCPLLPNAGP